MPIADGGADVRLVLTGWVAGGGDGDGTPTRQEIAYFLLRS